MRRAWTLGRLLAVLVLGMTLAWGPAWAASPVPPAARIRGTVRNAQGPVAGARVLLSIAEPGLIALPEDRVRRSWEAPVIARTTSAADGSFSLEAPRTGLAALWVESPGGVASRRDVRAGDPVDLLLEPGVVLSGVARDDAETPIAGALVTAVFQTHSRFFEAVTDATGHYSLGPLPRGEYEMFATHEGLVPAQRPVLGALSTRELDLWLSRPRRLSGVVLRDGLPVEGVRVEILHEEDPERHVLTDARGHFSFEGLKAWSEYVLRATHAGHQAFLPVDFDEKTSGGNRPQGPVERTGLTLTLAPAVSLRGTVRDEEGRPLARVQVTVSRRKKSGLLRVASVRTDARGQYAVDTLAPGAFQLQVEAEGRFSPTPRDLDIPEAPGQADFVLSPAIRLEGMFVDTEGQPVVDGSMTLSASDPSESFHAMSGADGRFGFTLAHPGRYPLRLSGEGVQTQSLEVTAPAVGLRVRTERLPLVRGEVVDALGLPLPQVQLLLWPEQARDEQRALGGAVTDVEGRFALPAPGPGRYRLSAELFLGRVTQTTSREVEVGTSGARASLRLDAGHALSGVVVDGKGRPQAGIDVDVMFSRRVEDWHCGSPVQGTTTDAEGRFSFQRVSGESLVLQAVDTREPPSYLKVHRQALTLTPGAATEVRVVLEDEAWWAPEGK